MLNKITKLRKLKTIKSRIDDIIAVQEEVYFKIYMRMKTVSYTHLTLPTKRIV